MAENKSDHAELACSLAASAREMLNGASLANDAEDMGMLTGSVAAMAALAQAQATLALVAEQKRIADWFEASSQDLPLGAGRE